MSVTGRPEGEASGQPTLTAGSLTLRPWRPEDCDQVHRACQDPLVQRFTRVPVPYRPEHAAQFIRDSGPGFREGSSAHFAVVDTDTGDLLGAVGLSEVDRKAGSAHVGYWVVPEGRGRGVAQMALDALTVWALEPGEGGLVRLVAVVDPDNAASVSVLRRAGYAATGVSDQAPCAPGAGAPLEFEFALPRSTGPR